MKANELTSKDLMVGDWLQDSFGNIGQVYRLDPGRVHLRLLQERPQDEEYIVHDIEPIPLTPEILKKNGFVNSYIDLSLNKDSVYKYNHFYTGNSVIVDMESNKLIVKYENDIWMNLPYNRTIYVHELQHVLKHCGINKEIMV